jgi:hypothetical protein
MPLRQFEAVEFGGVDSRSNPINMPQNRALRCLNWVPKQAGYLELRWGYSTLTMSAVTATAIHSLIGFRLNAGAKYLVIGQGAAIRNIDLSTGTVTSPTVRGAAISGSGKWQSYFTNNRLHMGNGTDQKFFDGTTVRTNGIRVPTAGEGAAVATAIGGADATGIPASTVGGANPGYQFYMAYYNQTTGQVGNRILIGSRLNNTQSSDFTITGLPDLSGEDTELVKVIGRTGDGAQVPYVIVDSGGNWITAGNTNTTISITQSGIDGNFELPTRNGVIPAQCNLFAQVGDYSYAGDTGSPTVRRSGSAIDSQQGMFMGRPEQSWAPNDIDTFPTGDACTHFAEFDYQLLVGTQNDCAILTDYSGTSQWQGPWNVGIAGPRAGVKTPYGYIFLSGEKELVAFANGLPVPFSEEYEAAELAQIGDAYLAAVEVTYYRNPSLGKDEVRVEGRKSDGTPHTIIHDFKLRDMQTYYTQLYSGIPSGQGYGSEFLGPLGTNFTIAQGRDANGKLQIYAGASTGQIYQLYSGSDDVGNQFTGDFIALINAGPERLSIPSMDWYGDANLVVSEGRTLSTSLATASEFTFEPLTPASDPGQAVQGSENDSKYRATMTIPEVQHIYLRLQLTSHSGDGSLALNSPPHVPLETYGRVYEVIPAIGAARGQ